MKLRTLTKTQWLDITNWWRKSMEEHEAMKELEEISGSMDVAQMAAKMDALNMTATEVARQEYAKQALLRRLEDQNPLRVGAPQGAGLQMTATEVRACDQVRHVAGGNALMGYGGGGGAAMGWPEGTIVRSDGSGGVTVTPPPGMTRVVPAPHRHELEARLIRAEQDNYVLRGQLSDEERSHNQRIIEMAMGWSKARQELKAANAEAAKWETIASGHRRDLEALQAENKRLKEDLELRDIALSVVSQSKQDGIALRSIPHGFRRPNGYTLSRAIDNMGKAALTMGLPAGGDRY